MSWNEMCFDKSAVCYISVHIACTPKWLLYLNSAENYLRNEYQHDMVPIIMSKVCQLLFRIKKTSLLHLYSYFNFYVTATNWKAMNSIHLLQGHIKGLGQPPPQDSKYYFRYTTKAEQIGLPPLLPERLLIMPLDLLEHLFW